MRILLAVLAVLGSAIAAVAEDLQLDGQFTQGGLVIGTAPAGSKVVFNGRSVLVSSQGRFLIGFSRDAAPRARLRIQLPSGRQIDRDLSINKREYQIQRIDGLPRKMVTPLESDYARIRSENAQIAKARARNSKVPRFESGWIWPTRGRITGVYGSQRILNGQPRQPHYGIDIAAPTGTLVLSPADAVVALDHHGMYYTGGTIILDHGHGLTSAMLHLDKIVVRVGESVLKGQKIGTVGKTGRATGPHLDWRINLFDVRLDPALLVPPMLGQ